MGLNNIKINNTTNVKTGVVYDISKATGQTYDTLADALGTDGKNVPSEVREGGMSVRFVHTGDNMYVQYRLTAQIFTTDNSIWEPVGNPLVKAARTPGKIDLTLIHYLIPATRGAVITNAVITELFGRTGAHGFISTANPLNIVEIGSDWHCYRFEIPEGSYGFLFNKLSIAVSGKIQYAEYDENMNYLAHNVYDYSANSSLQNIKESFIPVVQGAKYIVFNMNNTALSQLLIYSCSRQDTLKLLDGTVGEYELKNRSVGNAKLDYNSVHTENILDESVTPAKTKGILETSSINLVDPLEILENTYISPDGSITQYDSYYTSGFIAITPGLDYYQALGARGVYRKLAVFDQNRQAIPELGSAEEQDFPINISDQRAAYIRFSKENASLSIAQLTQSSTPLPYVRGGYSLVKGLIQADSIGTKELLDHSVTEDKTSFLKSRNLFNKNSDKNILNCYISSNGSLVSSQDYLVSHPIYVKPYTDYFVGKGMNTQSIRTFVVYDEFGNFLYGDDTARDHIFITYEQAYYIRCSFNIADFNSGFVQLTESTERLSYSGYEPMLPIASVNKGNYIRCITTEPLTLVEQVTGRYANGYDENNEITYGESEWWRTSLYRVDVSKLVGRRVYARSSCPQSGQILIFCLDSNKRVVAVYRTDKETTGSLDDCMDVYAVPLRTRFILLSSTQAIWDKEEARAYVYTKRYSDLEYPANLPGYNKVIDLIPRAFGDIASITLSFTPELAKSLSPLFECVTDVRGAAGNTLHFIKSTGAYLTARWVYVIKRLGQSVGIEYTNAYTIQEDDFLVCAAFYYRDLPDYTTTYENGNISLIAVTISNEYTEPTVFLQAESSERPQNDNQLMTYKNVRDLIDENTGDDDTHVLNILNSDRICLIGDSYTESHFTVKNKAYVNKLSLFSDYNFMNVAVSGDIYTGQLNKIRSHSEPYGANYAKYLPKYTMLCCFTNDIKYMNATTFLGCLENAINYVRSLGSEPIVCTEYHVSGNEKVLESGMAALADKYKVMFFDIAHIVRNVRGVDYAPFWGGSHAGTRPNALESDSYEMYLENMERPLQSLKLFRLRSGIDYSNLDNITFLDNYQRARLFKEINVGHSALRDNSNVDNCTDAANSRVNDEYRILGDGGNVEFGNVALASFVLPLTANHVGIARLDLGGTFNGTIYIRDAKATPFPNITMYQRFDYASGQTKPSVGDKYVTTRGGDSVTFTVVGIIDGIGEPGSDGVIFCSPMASKYSDTSAGTLTKSSGSGPETINFVYSSPGYMFPSGMPEDTCGHWIELTPTNGNYIISEETMKRAMQLDRLDVLLVNNSTFTLNDISLTFKGTLGKNSVRMIEDILPNYLRDSSELIPHPTFGTAGYLDENWNVTPTKVYEDVTANIKTYPVGCSSKVNVGNGTTISTIVQGVGCGHYMLEVTARYFPDIYTNGSGNQITEDSFDYAKLKVILTVGNSRSEVPLYKKVNTHWKLCQFKLVFRENQNLTIKITSDDAVIEVAKVSLKKLD